jgi:hypothetical protein
MLHFLLQGGGWFLLFGEEVFFEGLNVVDGSLEYIDLRFDGKVYLKRRE